MSKQQTQRSNGLGIITAIVLLAAITTTAQAELRHKDNFTRDTETGLDWLDLSDTAGYSVANIRDFGGGGFIAAGWRIATTTELRIFLESATLVPVSVERPGIVQGLAINASTDQINATRALINCVGSTSDVNVPGEAPGIFSATLLGFTRDILGWYLDEDGDDRPVGRARVTARQTSTETNMEWILREGFQ